MWRGVSSVLCDNIGALLPDFYGLAQLGFIGTNREANPSFQRCLTRPRQASTGSEIKRNGPMKTRIIAITTAIAIASMGLSAPARANNADELARILIGAAIIGALVHTANNPPRATVTYGPPRGYYRPTVPPRPAYVTPQMPRQCMRREYTRRGWVNRFAPRCMADMGWTKNGAGRWVPTRHAYR